MDCKRIQVLVPTPVEVPRGAEWAASAVVWVMQEAMRGAHLWRRSAVAFDKGDPDDSRDDSALSSSHVAQRTASGVAQ
jgi:hypothetical protein